MVALQTPSCNFNWEAPNFHLQNIDGSFLSLDNIAGDKGTLLMFICNHCPFVQAIIGRLIKDCQLLQNKGIGIAAIMPNDTHAYPDDSFDNMKIFAKNHNFTFPYLWDSTQEVARLYDAVCTPDFYGFNINRKLQYRGRYDSSGRFPSDTTQHELYNAMLMIASSGCGPEQQTPSIGCSIKWADKSYS